MTSCSEWCLLGSNTLIDFLAMSLYLALTVLLVKPLDLDLDLEFGLMVLTFFKLLATVRFKDWSILSKDDRSIAYSVTFLSG